MAIFSAISSNGTRGTSTLRLPRGCFVIPPGRAALGSGHPLGPSSWPVRRSTPGWRLLMVWRRPERSRVSKLRAASRLVNPNNLLGLDMATGLDRLKGLFEALKALSKGLDCKCHGLHSRAPVTRITSAMKSAIRVDVESVGIRDVNGNFRGRQFRLSVHGVDIQPRIAGVCWKAFSSRFCLRTFDPSCTFAAPSLESSSKRWLTALTGAEPKSTEKHKRPSRISGALIVSITPKPKLGTPRI